MARWSSSSVNTRLQRATISSSDTELSNSRNIIHVFQTPAPRSKAVSSLAVGERTRLVVGDEYAQEELDAEKAEAERYPLGVKEFCPNRLVGRAFRGIDQHSMTDEEFDADRAEAKRG